MALPELADGVLPPGQHEATADEVLDAFGRGTDARVAAGRELQTLLAMARAGGAKYALIGGSFASDKPTPRDVDVVLVYESRRDIPPTLPLGRWKMFVLDVQFASEDEPAILSAFIQFFSTQRDRSEAGLIRIALSGATSFQVRLPEPDQSMVDGITAAYQLRHTTTVDGARGLLVTIHGIRTHAAWNADVARLASHQGWVVAPFVYGYAPWWVLISGRARREIVGQFRDWIDRIAREHQLPVSVIAHSFGTYIAVKYLLGFDAPPHRFQAMVLTGCILDPALDWSGLGDRVGGVLHECAPNDFWVSKMSLVRRVSGERLFGSAGAVGFTDRPSFLDERRAGLFDHGNVIKPDVISGRWLPYLNAHRQVAD